MACGNENPQPRQGERRHGRAGHCLQQRRV